MTLPHGFTARLTDKLRTSTAGDLLVGGAPLTAIRLSPRAQQLIHNGSVTVTDPATAQLARRLLSTNLAHPDLTSAPDIGAD